MYARIENLTSRHVILCVVVASTVLAFTSTFCGAKIVIFPDFTWKILRTATNLSLFLPKSPFFSALSPLICLRNTKYNY